MTPVGLTSDSQKSGASSTDGALFMLLFPRCHAGGLSHAQHHLCTDNDVQVRRDTLVWFTSRSCSLCWLQAHTLTERPSFLHWKRYILHVMTFLEILWLQKEQGIQSPKGVLPLRSYQGQLYTNYSQNLLYNDNISVLNNNISIHVLGRKYSL